MPKTAVTQNQLNNRIYWGQRSGVGAFFDLTYLQKQSYDWFIKEGIGQILSSVSPVVDFTGKNWQLQIGEYFLGKPRYSPEDAALKGVTYDSSLRVKVT